MPATLLLSVVTFCAAVVVCWAGWSGQMRLAFLAVTTVILKFTWYDNLDAHEATETGAAVLAPAMTKAD